MVFFGKLKEPKIIKGLKKHFFFLSFEIIKSKPIIICLCDGKIVELDPFEHIFDNDNSSNNTILTKDDLNKIESYEYNKLLKYL